MATNKHNGHSEFPGPTPVVHHIAMVRIEKYWEFRKYMLW